MEKSSKDEGSLPGLAGAAKAVIDSKPVGALLNPAAKIFGEYLGERANELTEKWRSKRRTNLAKQIDLADQIDGPAGKEESPSEEQAEFAFDWAESAQRVNFVDDPDLAALWASLLTGIRNNDRNTKQALAALKLLNPEDAEVLLNCGLQFRGVRYPQPTLNRLVSAGVIEKKDWRRVVLILLTVFSALVTSITWLAVVKPPQVFLDDRPWTDIQRIVSLFQQPLVLISFTIFAGSFGFLIFYQIQDTFRLTELGENLQLQGRRYRSQM